MLRQCRKCANCAVAVGTACTLCGEFAAATVEPESSVRLYIGTDVGTDQPHTHDEPKAPTPTGTLTVRAVTTASTVAQPQRWINIPASIASSPFLWWQAPPPPTY
jgi:hypothetical protein